MPITFTKEEGTNLLALFEQMRVKPEGNTPEELQQWLQVHFAVAAVIRCSLKGKAAHVLKRLGPTATAADFTEI